MKEKRLQTLDAINLVEEIGVVLSRYEKYSPSAISDHLRNIMNPPAIPAEYPKGSLLEMLRFGLQKWYKSRKKGVKSHIAEFAVKHNLTQVKNAKTLTQGNPIYRIICEAFDASEMDLMAAIQELHTMGLFVDIPKTLSGDTTWNETIRNLK